jgi:hypothetical protein
VSILFFAKDLYGINEAKIQAYSPSEAQKIYERPVNRKANARFNPAATVEIIRMGEPVAANMMDEEGRRDLVAKYLGVSHLNCHFRLSIFLSKNHPGCVSQILFFPSRIRIPDPDPGSRGHNIGLHPLIPPTTLFPS